MRRVEVENIEGWIESSLGVPMAVHGARFTAYTETGKAIIRERRDGMFSRYIGKFVVRTRAFVEDHLNHVVYDNPPADNQ